MNVYTDEVMLEHGGMPGHPEQPERLQVAVAALRAADLPHVTLVSPRPVTDEQILRVHTPAHLQGLIDGAGKTTVYDIDTQATPRSLEAARLAAGAVVDAVDAVYDDDPPHAFALVRPPGHHAEPARAMGFCLLGNVAIAAEHALATRGARRVLIVDWDVHHGNGTQAAFYDRDDVLYFSVHESPLYPGTGARHETGIGPGTGFTINVPLPAGQGDVEYVDVLEQTLVPRADAYAPDLVLVSAGFDAHVDDPLGSMRVTAAGFRRQLDIVRGIADRHARGRLVLALEGGYDLDALAECVVACAAGLGSKPPTA